MFIKKYTQPQYQLGHVSYSPIFNSFDQLFDRAFDKLAYSYSSRLKLNETDSHYELSIDLPGYANKDIDVSVEDYVLTVRANNEKYGETVRRTVLWEGIDFDKVSAKVENGVLLVSLPKVEKDKPKKIKVE